MAGIESATYGGMARASLSQGSAQLTHLKNQTKAYQATGKQFSLPKEPRTDAPHEKTITPKRQAELNRLKGVADDMEGLFVNMMLKEMRKNTFETKFIHGGHAEEIFQDMLYDKYAQRIATSENLGIAEMIESQMSKYI